MEFIKKYKQLSTEVKASIVYIVCNILTNCLALITLPIFTRMMTTEEYGLSTVYTSTAAIVVIFVSLQLPYGSLSTAMIKFKEDREGYLSSICGISSIFTIGYIIFCCIFKNQIVKWLDLPFFLIIIMGVEMLFSTATAAWMGYQRFEYKYKNIFFVTMTTSIFNVFLSLIVVMVSNQKGIAKVCSNTLVVSIVGFIIFLKLLRKGRKPFKKEYWKFALSFNIPLIPYYLSQVIFNQSDRLMINNICGRGDAAIYGVAYSIATILTFIVTSIHSSYTPWIFERIDRKELKSNRKVTMILSSGIAFMLLGIIAFAPEIVYVMAGKQYVKAIWAIPPVAMSVLLLYYSDLFDCLLFFYEAKIFLAVATIGAAIINVILNLIFIPRFGFIVAAYTTLASYVLLASADYIYMLRICKKNNIDKNLYNIKGLITVFVAFSLLGFTAMSLYQYPLIRYLVIVFVLIVLFVFRKKIIELFNVIKKV